MEDDEQARTERFFGRCTAEQKRAWERAARQSKRSLSDWMRHVCDMAAAYEQMPATMELVEQVLKQLNEKQKRK